MYAIGLAARKGEKALGIAFKLEDGSTRARDAVALDVLARLHRLPGSARRLLARHFSPVLHNVRGLVVGAIEADVPLKEYRKLL